MLKPATVTVAVSPTPTVSLTPTSQIICSESSIALINIDNPNDISGTIFSWTRDNTTNLTGIAPNGTGSSISGSLTNPTNTQQTTIFTITASSASGCSSSTMATVIVNPRPTVIATPPVQTVCSATPFTQIIISNPNNIAGTTFSWTRTTPAGLSGVANSGTGSTIAGTFSNTTATPITTTFTITGTSGTCSSTTTAVVTVNPLPIVNPIAGPANVCIGNSITLTNSTVGGVWSSSNPGAAAINGNGIVFGIAAGNTTISYTVVDGNGCSRTVTTIITVNSLPSITLGTNPLVCGGITSATLPYSSPVGSPNQYSINFDAAANTAGFTDITNANLGASPIVLTIPAAAPAAFIMLY